MPTGHKYHELRCQEVGLTTDYIMKVQLHGKRGTSGDPFTATVDSTESRPKRIPRATLRRETIPSTVGYPSLRGL